MSDFREDLLTVILDCGYGDLYLLENCQYDMEEIIVEAVRGPQAAELLHNDHLVEAVAAFDLLKDIVKLFLIAVVDVRHRFDVVQI